MKSIYYINLIIGLSLMGLTGCTEVPITKTNCWSGAPSAVTSSTKSALLPQAGDPDALGCR